MNEMIIVGLGSSVYEISCENALKLEGKNRADQLNDFQRYGRRLRRRKDTNPADIDIDDLYDPEGWTELFEHARACVNPEE